MNVVLGLLWLLSGIVGTLTWTWCLGRHWERLQSQKRRGENGALREIALTALRRDYLGLLAAMIILAVLGVAISIEDLSVRMIVSRMLISLLALVVAGLGFQTMRDEERVMNKIREQLTIDGRLN